MSITYSLLLPKCEVFVNVSMIQSLYFSVSSTTNKYRLHLKRVKHSSIHSSQDLSVSCSFHCSFSLYGLQVNKHSYSPVLENISLHITVACNLKSLIIALLSSTC